jgi:hypothetical protein
VLGLLCVMSVAGCSRWWHQDTARNHYFCPPTMAYNADGSIDRERVSVEAACLDSQEVKIRKMYLEAK